MEIKKCGKFNHCGICGHKEVDCQKKKADEETANLANKDDDKMVHDDFEPLTSEWNFNLDEEWEKVVDQTDGCLIIDDEHADMPALIQQSDSDNSDSDDEYC